MFPLLKWRTGLFALSVFSGAAALAAGETDEVEFFEKRIRPVLVQHCYECHAEGAEESGLAVDSLVGLLRGGDRGPALVPGKPDESLLISAVRHGELLKMPPRRKLSTVEVADLERWVQRGAIWPGATPAAVASAKPAAGSPADGLAHKSHWAFQARQQAAMPGTIVDPWVATPVDAFVLERLHEAGLQPAAPAEKAILIRRAAVDLLGLTPSPEEVDAFVSDQAPDAWPRLIDRLLASPRYGERWGRHWLDVARYADSNGLDENLAYAHAYRYRDYVVSAWNRDLPFDQFIREQLAGDLLPPSGERTTDLDRLVATGFLSLGAKMLAEDDPVKMQMDIVDEQVDTVGRIFLAMTWGCARCHDHKYDPVSAADYYGLAGIFFSTKTMETHTVVARWLERPLGSPQEVAARDELRKQIDSLDTQIKETSDRESQRLVRAARRHLGDYLLAAHQAAERDRRLAALLPLGDNGGTAARTDVRIIEAEAYNRGNVIRDTANYGPGIGVLVNRGETPNFTEYDIQLEASGPRQVELRYAAASSRPTRLYVNGKLVKSNAAADVTGGWYPADQRWKVEGVFEFQAGANVIRLEQPQFFPHIDKLLLAPVPADQAISIPRLNADYEALPIFVSRWQKYLTDTPAERLPALLRPFTARESKAPQALREAAAMIHEAVATAEKKESPASPPDVSPQVAELAKLLADSDGPFSTVEELASHYNAETKTALENLRQQKTSLEAALPQLPEAMAVRDGTPQDLRIHLRGSHLTLGAVAPRRFPHALASKPPTLSPSSSGRLELAEWIAGPDHPLTARVIVNRIWQWHFGAGLVRSSDNFGLLGDAPSHSKLLDWLAEEFVRSGWSIKALHRLILLSATYRMSTQWNAVAAEKDPDNSLLWRFSRRRMEAEVLRDSLLEVSGQLDERMGGSLLPTANRQYVTSTANVDPVVYDSRRRSVYLPVVRSALYDVFQAFDFADPSVSQGKRETTTIAPQALFLMNSQFVSEQTGALATRLLANPGLDDQGRVHDLFRRALGRAATGEEVDRALRYIARYREQSPGEGSDAAAVRQRAWQSLCRAILSTNEFVYVE